MKEEIKLGLKKLEDIIANATDAKTVEKALKKYQELVKKAMKLNKDDFVGDAHEDYKYGFRMPKACRNHTHCRWICDNMVGPDGISNNTMESSQNLNITDVEDDDEGFESENVVDDVDQDNEEGEDGTDDAGDDPRLLEEDTDVAVVYSEEGFEADADVYEAGVHVDDASWDDGIDADKNSTSSGLLWYIFLGLFILSVSAWFIMKICIKGKDDETVEDPHHGHQMVPS